MISMYIYSRFCFEFKVGWDSNEVAQYLQTSQDSLSSSHPFSASLLQSAS
jgi:hypothetical protein